MRRQYVTRHATDTRTSTQTFLGLLQHDNNNVLSSTLCDTPNHKKVSNNTVVMTGKVKKLKLKIKLTSTGDNITKV